MNGGEFYPGRRLSYSRALCTVRYVGTVQGTRGEWLGVEWDLTGHGKHNGSHADVKYFDCRSKVPNSGSFVRPYRPYDSPLNFLQALRKKYAPSDDGESLTDWGTPISIDGKVVEEIGFKRVQDQLAKLHGLRVVLLDGLCLAGVQAQPWNEPQRTRQQSILQIHDHKLSIVELDLSRNVIERWTEIADICSTLRSLRILKVKYAYRTYSSLWTQLKFLSRNRFQDLSILSSKEDLVPFSDVRELELDETLLSWDDIVHLTKSFPSLTSLSAASNEITAITTPLPTPNLASLTLASNSITSLASIKPLALLPHLATLSLRSNPLISVSSPDQLPSLTHLDLKSTLLDSFVTISSLTLVCPALVSLLIANTPLSRLPSAFLLILARHPTLKSLNFSAVKPAERQNAELYYLSVIALELSEASSQEDKKRILNEHPRYPELCAIYGEPAALEKKDESTGIAPGTLEARIVEFTFYSIIDGNMVEKKKDIPRSFDVYRIKGILGRLFGVRPLECKLIWEMEEWDPVGREEDDIWSCSEEEWNNDDQSRSQAEADDGESRGKWVKREVELVDGTKDVGFWIDRREARTRVEPR